MANLLVIYYSAFGHVFQMAQAVADGANQSGANQVRIFRIPEMIAAQNRVIQQDKNRPRAENEQQIKLKILNFERR
jgi:NAD(P)H dehydrogenase (quinone)